MDPEAYIDPGQADAIRAGLESMAQAPRERVDLDAYSETYLSRALRSAARQRWEQACPPDMQESDWSHPSMQPFAAQIRQVLAFPATGPKGLCAAGETGYGKSRAMWALMRRLACDEGRDVRAYAAIDWFNTLESHVSFGRDEARGWVEAVARRPVVFIDDFGQEALQVSRQSWAMSWFFRFLDIRLGERLPLYMTTNLRSGELATSANARSAASIRGDPLVRRLSDLCEFIRFRD